MAFVGRSCINFHHVTVHTHTHTHCQNRGNLVEICRNREPKDPWHRCDLFGRHNLIASYCIWLLFETHTNTTHTHTQSTISSNHPSFRLKPGARAKIDGGNGYLHRPLERGNCRRLAGLRETGGVAGYPRSAMAPEELATRELTQRTSLEESVFAWNLQIHWYLVGSN